MHKSFEEVNAEAIAIYGVSIAVLPKGRNTFASHAQILPNYLGEIQVGEGRSYLVYKLAEKE
jgi:hypothetical protein